MKDVIANELWVRVTIKGNDAVNAIKGNGIYTFNEPSSITATPNPSASSFNLQLLGGNNATVQVRVVDASGRVVEQLSRAANQVIRLGA